MRLRNFRKNPIDGANRRPTVQAVPSVRIGASRGPSAVILVVPAMPLEDFMKMPRRSPLDRIEVRRGAATVEMAIAAPVLFVIIFGVFEITHAFMIQHLIQDAARQGCRVAICPLKTNQDVQSMINSVLAREGVTGATTTILVNNATTDVVSARAGDDVSVKIQLDTSSIAMYPGGGYLYGQLTAAYTLRHE